MKMVYVPPGEFEMGNSYHQVDEALAMCNATLGNCSRYWFVREIPAHSVSLDAYWIDRTEVSNAQYRLCVEAGACEPPGFQGSPARDEYYGGVAYSDFPVTWVNWSQATAYCLWVGGRLPTEAEWEYAAAGPEDLPFPWGAVFHGEYLNYCDRNCNMTWSDDQVDDGHGRTSPVGNYQEGASWCGALDMAGNVWEWVADWKDADYYGYSPRHNPQGPRTGETRIQRGGSWGSDASHLRNAYRSSGLPTDHSEFTGFRCAIAER